MKKYKAAAVFTKYRGFRDFLIKAQDLNSASFLRRIKVRAVRQTSKEDMNPIKMAVNIGAGAIVAVFGVPVVLGALGFTSAGIAAGSIGAKMMSTAAVANGGGVAAGGLVASLQAAGAAGLSGAATAAVAGTGAAVGWLTSLFR